MKRLFTPLVLCVALAGCVGGLSYEAQQRLAEIQKRNDELADRFGTVLKALHDGTMTKEAGKEAFKGMQDELMKGVAEVAEIKVREKMTVWGTVIVAASVAGRSALHSAASGAIPLGPLAPIQPLLALILGGSLSRRKGERAPKDPVAS